MEPTLFPGKGECRYTGVAQVLGVLFLLLLQCIPGGNACGGTLTSPSGNITSPNYPLHYPSSLDCEWIIRVSPRSMISLTFLDFETTPDNSGCDYYFDDYVEIRQGSRYGTRVVPNMCGSPVLGTITSRTTLSILFHSGYYSNYNYRGFKAEYRTDLDLGSARLVGSQNVNEGRLEHYVSGSWSPVCADGFNLNAASVVCNELGLSPNHAIYTLVNSNSSITAADDMKFQCTGSEPLLSLCPVNVGPCSTEQVIHVKCFVPECGVIRDPRGPSTRIIGGTRAHESQFPWMAMLIVNNKFDCGGAIIDPLHIATAAHCISDQPTFSIQVSEAGNVTGTVKLTEVTGMEIIAGKHEYSITQDYSGEQRVRVQAAIYHALYHTGSASYSNDIALLRLERPLTFNHRVSSLCLPEATSQLPNQCVVAGWGRIENLNLPSELMTVTMAAYDRQGCIGLADYMSWYYQDWGQHLDTRLPQNAMCLANATYGGQSTCNGDSGSAVFCLDPSGLHYQLMGIVSWGYKGCPTSVALPSVCTFVPPYLDWIVNATRRLASPCASNPCSSSFRSICLDLGDTYQCVCRAGYQGDYCMIDINECTRRPCQNGGRCVNVVGSFQCLCTSGFYGPQCDQACSGNLTGQSGALASINYPQYYEANMDCHWDLHVPQGHTVQIKFLDFQLETCPYDYLEIREMNSRGRLVQNKLCGYLSTPFTVQSSVSLWIYFHSDRTTNNRGFNAIYQMFTDLCTRSPCQQNCNMSRDLSSYVCSCNSGYKLNGDNVTCGEGKSLSFTVIIRESVDFDENDPSQPSYQLLKEQVRNQLLENLVHNNQDVLDVNIFQLMKGSVVVKAEALVAKDNVTRGAAQLASSLIQLSEHRLKIDFDWVYVVVMVNKMQVTRDTPPCDVMTALGVCNGDSGACDDSTGVPVCSHHEASGLKRPAVIGIAVTSVVVVMVILIGIVIYVCRWHNKKQAEGPARTSAGPRINGNVTGRDARLAPYHRGRQDTLFAISNPNLSVMNCDFVNINTARATPSVTSALPPPYKNNKA